MSKSRITPSNATAYNNGYTDGVNYGNESGYKRGMIHGYSAGIEDCVRELEKNRVNKWVLATPAILRRLRKLKGQKHGAK